MDMVPPLRHLYARSKWLRKYLDDWHEEANKIFVDFYDGAKEAQALGTPCVSNSLSKFPEDDIINQTVRAWTAAAFFSARQETTAAMLQSIVFSLLLHPEVMRRAQAELDDVVDDRPPTFSDKDNLPYILAVIKEVSRWRPTAPAGVPHRASDDIEYEGHVIPKGTWILDNIWSQSRDRSLYGGSRNIQSISVLGYKRTTQARRP